MFGRVLVGFDGSAGSEDALALAQRLLDPAAGVLTLACVARHRGWYLPHRTPEAPAPIREDLALVLAGGRARVRATVHVRLRSPVAGSAARGLTELAEAERADLVVVGSGGRTAARLLQGAPCAVAVAPSGWSAADPFRHVGIAYDGSPEADAALAAGYGIAAASAAAVTLFCALTAHPVIDAELERDRHRARLEAQERLDRAAELAPPGVNPRTLLLFGDPESVIPAAAEGIVDLIVTGSRGYGPLQRVLAGSVAQSLIEDARQPVLVLPRQPKSASARAPALQPVPLSS